MKCVRALAGLLLVTALVPATAVPPHLELEVTLDPHTRKLQVKADLTTSAGRPDIALDRMFSVSRVAVDGVNVRDATGRDVPKPQGAGAAQRWSMEYSGTLPPLPEGRQRSSPNPASIYASPAGSYLSAGAGWYPDPGVPFTYRLRLSLPPDQKALVPGRQTHQEESAARYVAEYDFPHPAEGIWLMAGPYQVARQSFRLEDGSPVVVRTWFHPELSGLASDYLQDSMRYIQRYSRLIGPYPFGDFSIVSSPLSHGVGMPSLTYLGRDVLRLPFIRATSLGHEVLHNWWGNGVYPEWSSGNWSEGLTTFMADYAYREDQSEQAAREIRLNWLRDLAAVAARDETSLVEFRSRHHGISSVIGYGKSAMVFFMLRDEIGRPAFEQGLRLLWRRFQFRTANWRDLQAVFAEASGHDLSAFFAQWTQRASSPQLLLAPVPAPAAANSSIRLIQQGDVFDLLVPLLIRTASGETREMKLRMRERETIVDLASAAIPAGANEVELDPDLRLWRRLEPRAVPPIFRDTFIAPRAEVFLASTGADWVGPAMSLAGRLLDAQPRQVSGPELLSSDGVPVLVVGDRAGVTRLLPGLGFDGLPQVLLQESAPSAGGLRPLKGSAQAWTARAASGRSFTFVIAEDPQALAALQRSMPHYGRQSWLVFQDGRVAGQGAWPVTAQTLSVQVPAR
jgi:aminopeptidase N